MLQPRLLPGLVKAADTQLLLHTNAGQCCSVLQRQQGNSNDQQHRGPLRLLHGEMLLVSDTGGFQEQSGQLTRDRVSAHGIARESSIEAR